MSQESKCPVTGAANKTPAAMALPIVTGGQTS